MSLINLQNADSVFGRVRSVQLTSPSHGQRYVEATATYAEIMDAVVYLAHSSATVAQLREIIGLLSRLLGARVAVNALQQILNRLEFEATAIVAQVEFAIYTTGHGEVESSNVVLLPTTTWQQS